MQYKVTIAGVEIPEKYILEFRTSEISLNFAGDKLISSQSTITLSNHDYMYDDRQNTGGFFSEFDWYNATIIVFDNEFEETVWEGRLKKMEINDSNLTVNLTVNDYIQDLVDTVCVINLPNTTVAGAIYTILTNPLYLAIPESRLIKSGFDLGIAQQQNQFISITYTAQDNQKCISVLEELCKISNSHLFQRDNKIGYWVWTQYTGTLGTPIYDKDVLPVSYSQYTNDAEILNEYSIAYNNTTVTAYATGSDEQSKTRYGSGKLFAVPSSRVESTSISSFKILYKTAVGANYIGNQIIARHKNIKKICSIVVGYHLNYLSLGDILDLKFSPFIREPVRVIKIKPNREKQTIELSCEYINYPEVVPLNLIKPDPVEMYEVTYLDGAIILKWSHNFEKPLLIYKLHFSNSSNYWGEEYSYGRFSPLTIPISSLEFDNTNVVYNFSPVDKGKTYYFKVSAVDNSYNQSDDSNVVSFTVPEDIEVPSYAAQHYRSEGNLIDGVVFKDGVGAASPEFTTYDSVNYDSTFYSFSGYYVSEYIGYQHGYNNIILKASQHYKYFKIQYRTYINGTNSAWIDAPEYLSASGYTYKIEFENTNTQIVQFRIFFEPLNYSTTYSVHIDQIS